MIVFDVGLTESVAYFLKDENLELKKNYEKVCLYRDFSLYSDTESYEAQQTYSDTINGLEERTI